MRASIEQVIDEASDNIIITWDPHFHANVYDDSLWADIKAVRESASTYVPWHRAAVFERWAWCLDRHFFYRCGSGPRRFRSPISLWVESGRERD